MENQQGQFVQEHPENDEPEAEEQDEDEDEVEEEEDDNEDDDNEDDDDEDENEDDNEDDEDLSGSSCSSGIDIPYNTGSKITNITPEFRKWSNQRGFSMEDESFTKLPEDQRQKIYTQLVTQYMRENEKKSSKRH